jgi:MerR family transcriptional regulator, heat shock protein HspR
MTFLLILVEVLGPYAQDLYCGIQVCYSAKIRPAQVPEGVVPTSSSTGVFAISVVAEMTSMQIQNLRVYERRGLVEPARTAGGTRLYSPDDVERLIRIRDLLAEGLNLAGIGQVLTLESEVERLRADNTRLRRRGRGVAGREGAE